MRKKNADDAAIIYANVPSYHNIHRNVENMHMMQQLYILL